MKKSTVIVLNHKKVKTQLAVVKPHNTYFILKHVTATGNIPKTVLLISLNYFPY